MVRIRLRRVGAKKKPTYRVVVADQRSPRVAPARPPSGSPTSAST